MKAILIFFLIYSCTPISEVNQWDAILLGFPDEISPKKADINMALYILKQTHEPIFRIQHKNKQYYSKILKKFSREQFKIFNLCLKKNIRFDTDKHFTPKDFMKYIKEIFPQKPKIKISGDCIQIQFSKPKTNFFRVLSEYKKAPSVMSNIDKVEVGLGPYKIVKKDDKQIILIRKKKKQNGYNRIVFHNYSGGNHPKLQDRSIEDFNCILLSDFPAWVKKEYNTYHASLLQTWVLVINHPDKKIREFLYNCIKIREFRSIFAPSVDEYLDIGGLLPVGIPGAIAKSVHQKCINTHSHSNEKIVFFNWNQGIKKELDNYFSRFNKKFKTNIHVVHATLDDLIKNVLISPHPYNLTVVSLETVTNDDYDAFYSYFIKDGNKTHDVSLPKEQEVYERFKAEQNMDLKPYLAKTLDAKLQKKFIYIPLYQENRTYHYPKRVKKMIIGQSFLEYPEISELEL